MMANLQYARELWANNEDIIAKRNLAFAECYKIIGSSIEVLDLRWDFIHFTDKPFTYYNVTRWGNKQSDLPKTCVDALLDYLGALWALYSKTTLPLETWVFKNRLNPDKMVNAPEDVKAIYAIGMNYSSAVEVSQLKRPPKSVSESKAAIRAKPISSSQTKNKTQLKRKEFTASPPIERLFTEVKPKDSDEKVLAQFIKEYDECEEPGYKQPRQKKRARRKQIWADFDKSMQEFIRFGMPTYRKPNRQWVNDRLDMFGKLSIAMRLG